MYLIGWIQKSIQPCEWYNVTNMIDKMYQNNKCQKYPTG